MNLGRLASLVMFSTCNEIPQEKKKRRFTVLLPVSFSVPLPPPPNHPLYLALRNACGL